MTVVGAVRVDRAYYHCRACRAGHCPRDGRLGLDRSDLSRGACRVVALAGTVSSFAEAATETLPELCGLRVSESTVERTTERVGADVEVLAEDAGHPVLVREGKILAATFHPELSDDTGVHEYFVGMARDGVAVSR